MTPRRIAYFVSAHGFGHAARACAVIETLGPGWRAEVVSAAPEWFFADSLTVPFAHYPLEVDVGLVQRDALEEDLDATARALERWYPLHPERVAEAAAPVASCELVVADVAPLGIAVARHLGVPSVLIENFTWDWIYRAYPGAPDALRRAAEHLEQIYADATIRVQTEPLCAPMSGARRVAPISRSPRHSRAEIRARLGVPDDAPLVLVTMGGIEWDYRGLEDRLGAHGPLLVVPGAASQPRRVGRAILLPHRSAFYHPDLIHAADAVLGKLGYSTVAEVARAGVPFAYVPRPRFPESPLLEAWVRRHLACLRLEPEDFTTWRWLDRLDDVVALPRRAAPASDGAEAVAEIVAELPSGLGVECPIRTESRRSIPHGDRAKDE